MTLFGSTMCDITNISTQLSNESTLEDCVTVVSEQSGSEKAKSIQIGSQLAESVQPAESIQPAESVQPAEYVQPAESVQQTESVQICSQPATSVQIGSQPDASVQIGSQPVALVQIGSQPAASVQIGFQSTSSMSATGNMEFLTMDQKIYSERLAMLQEKKKAGMFSKKQFEKEKHKLRRELDQRYNCKYYF